jgi:hypothetical protein
MKSPQRILCKFSTKFDNFQSENIVTLSHLFDKENRMKKTTLLLIVCLIQIIGLTTVFAQTQVGIPVKGVDAYILEFKEPFREMLVDVNPDDNNFSTEDIVIVKITPETKFPNPNKKGNPIEPQMIRRVKEISIRGERLGSALTAAEIKLKTDLEKWEVKLNGYFEFLEGDKAWIDGRAVKLTEGVVVKGTDLWKNKTFNSFNEMMLGSEVELKGTLRPDGIIYATEIETRPNLYSKTDQRLALQVQKGTSIPNGLSGGVGMVLGKPVKFVQNLELQTYINKVGNKVIPRFQKDLPKDDPGKITFRFMVIEDESFNAFALPDGSIFVHTGLLKQIQNEAQLAAVLGHEVAHVTHEHTRRREDCWKCDLGALAILVGVAMTGNDAIMLAGHLGSAAMLNKFSRDAERQADRVGLLYMYEAGYDPREAANVWRTIARESKQSAFQSFFYSSHPMARERVKNLNRELSYNFYEADFSQVKKGDGEYARIVGGYFGWAQTASPVPALQNLGVNSPTPQATTPNTSSIAAPSQAKNPSVPPISKVSEDGFKAFYAEFKKAVLADNRIGIKKRTATAFTWASDGKATADEALQNMDSMKLWTALKAAVAQNPSPCQPSQCFNRSGYRVSSGGANRFEILFEREANGEWKWSAILAH